MSVPFEPLLLARTDAVAVSVGGFVAYPTGVEFDLTARRRTVDEADDWVQKQMHWRHPRPGQDIPAEILRFGVELSDGRKATNLDGWVFRLDPHDTPPDQPVLMPRGGGGGGLRWDQGLWLWPLPPAGRLSLVVEWPSEGIALTRVDIDAAGLVDASKRALTLWEAPPGYGSGQIVESSGASQHVLSIEVAQQPEDDVST